MPMTSVQNGEMLECRKTKYTNRKRGIFVKKQKKKETSRDLNQSLPYRC